MQPSAPEIDRRDLDAALNDILAASLRPVCVGLALFYALLTVWYGVDLEGAARINMIASTALLSIGLVVGAIWFERNHLPGWLAHPAASVIGFAAILNALFLLVTVPEPQQTTNLMILQLGFGCLLFSQRWFAGLALLSFLGFGFVVEGRSEDPDWGHFGIALFEATLFGALVLAVRIRAYRNIESLRLRDQVLVKQLRDANQAAQVAVKAKSEFLANMSHELRTPMTAMLGMTELLQMTELSEDQREFAATIDRAGNNLLQLVNDILDFSKMEAGQLAVEHVDFELRAVLESVQELLAVKARQKSLSLTFEITPNTPLRYRGDPTRLRQVLVNLVGNAIKFTDHGFVRVRAQGHVLDGARATLELAVEDSGIGIPADKLDHVFEAFTQADASTTRRYGGTGLGLAISRQLMLRLGGELRATSEVGKGSIFTASIVLPVASATPEAQAPAEDERALARYEGRVLLVEDNPDNQSLAVQLLQRMGCDVEQARDGREALERLDSEKFDLVLMDCHMPNMNGYDATREIRRRESGNGGHHVPIVALTASVLPEERARCEEVGMDAYIAKPFSRRDLQQVLEKFL